MSDPFLWWPFTVLLLHGSPSLELGGTVHTVLPTSWGAGDPGKGSMVALLLTVLPCLLQPWETKRGAFHESMTRVCFRISNRAVVV